jgi:hypothetical protein
MVCMHQASWSLDGFLVCACNLYESGHMRIDMKSSLETGEDHCA